MIIEILDSTESPTFKNSLSEEQYVEIRVIDCEGQLVVSKQYSYEELYEKYGKYLKDCLDDNNFDYALIENLEEWLVMEKEKMQEDILDNFELKKDKMNSNLTNEITIERKQLMDYETINGKTYMKTSAVADVIVNSGLVDEENINEILKDCLGINKKGKRV
jgi:hypothetical protein